MRDTVPKNDYHLRIAMTCIFPILVAFRGNKQLLSQCFTYVFFALSFHKVTEAACEKIKIT